MLLLLTACNEIVQGTPGLEKDSDTGVTDSADTADSADTGETGDTGPVEDTFASDTGANPYDCGVLSAPMATGTLADVTAVLPVLAFDQEGFEYAVTKAVEYRIAASGTCDALITDGSGRTILSGDCVTADGHAYAGFATVQVSELQNSYEFEDFAFTMVGTDGELSLSVNGNAIWEPDGGQDIDVHYSLTATGSGFPGQYGEYVRNQAMSRTRLGQVGAGYVWIVSSETGMTGELCFDVNYSQDESVCPIEPYGEAAFVGQSVTDVVFDGDSACDGCVNMTVDGVDQGSVCP